MISGKKAIGICIEFSLKTITNSTFFVFFAWNVFYETENFTRIFVGKFIAGVVSVLFAKAQDIRGFSKI